MYSKLKDGQQGEDRNKEQDSKDLLAFMTLSGAIISNLKGSCPLILLDAS